MSTRRTFLTHAAVVGSVAAGFVPTVRSLAGIAANGHGVMRSCKIPHTDLVVSRMAYGGFLGGLDRQSSDFMSRATQLMITAYDNGITFFDLADYYGAIKSEVALGEMPRQSPGLRHRVVIQTKCGILHKDDSQPTGVDLSHDHIVSSAEGSLKRLGIDHIDILLLHEPDALASPEEVGRSLDDLKRSGKVRYFGVSNHTAVQIELLKKYLH